jgi:TRAP-type C4-dicarboxylate transport system permease small subunit
MTVYNLLKQKINKKILIFICLTIIIFEIIFLTRTWQNFVHLN